MPINTQNVKVGMWETITRAVGITGRKSKWRKAHSALDLAVDRLYRKAPFTSERERVEHLFGLYEKMVAPIEAAAKVKGRKKTIGA